MVHRSTDSRLLSSLISAEKDYCKSLEGALSSGHASLASFSAYAAASPPHISTIILSVANVFIGAQDALKHYAYAVEEWKELLTQLKGLEDEVANIIRDREILITRLIKVSKSSSTRDSILSNSSPSSSLNDLSGLGSSKLNRAQAELQACEAQLALKERELEASRTRVITQGLSVRCKGLAECGHWWSEKGKEGLNILGVGPPNQQDKPLPEPASIPLPHHTRGPPSDVSSTNSTLSPSQSASQIDVPAAIPPAHAISSEYVPSPPVSFPGSHSSHVLSRRITEESLNDNVSTTSSSEEQSQEIEVVENPRFTNGKASIAKPMPRKPTLPAAISRDHINRERKLSSSTPSSPVAPKSGFLGSIRGLFRSTGSSRGSNASNDSEEETRRPSRLRRDKGRNRSAAPTFDEPAAPTTPPSKPPTARRRSVSATPRSRATAGEDRILGTGTSSLARNDSLTSAVSAPATSGRRSISASVSSPLARAQASLVGHQRSGSLDDLDLRPSRGATEQRKAKQERRSTVQSFPQGAGTGASTSLMSIVEDVARERREGERRESLVAKPTPTVEIADSPLEAIRAPPSLGRKELEALTTTPPRHSGLKSYSETHLVTPVVSRTPSPSKASGPPKTPLRSALRKTSAAEKGESPSGRSASPAQRTETPSKNTPTSNRATVTSRIPPNPTSPPPQPPVVLPLPTAPKFVPPEEPKPASLPPPSPPAAVNGTSEPYDDDDDASSIESFETGHESWGSSSESSTATLPGRPVQEVIVEHPSPKEEPERPSTPTQTHPRPLTPATPATLPSASVTDLPATAAPAPTENGNAAPASASAPASDEGATGGGAPARRRKSVRVSLKPTFSPTPPAIEDDEHAPWSLGYAGAKAAVVNERTARGDRAKRDKDLWEDSSDEEVEYATAKRMLNRLKGKK